MDSEDVRSKDTWVVFKIMGEFVEGFETLRPVWPAVSIFGSARAPRRSRYYKDTVDIASMLSDAGFSIITGGGPGIMEAANKGADVAGGRSIGLSIKLPFEQTTNEFVHTSVDFNYFFARKVMFVKYACGFVGIPGGFGTLDEIFEALTLIQTRKIHDFPVVLYGSDYWNGLLQWLKDGPLRERMISRKDLQLFKVTDDKEELVEIMQRRYVRRQRSSRHQAGGHETP